jgi:O-antigen biosynthesis protein
MIINIQDSFIFFVNKVKKMGLKNAVVNSINKHLYKSKLDYVLKHYDYEERLDTKEICKEIKGFSYKPLISVVMPVYNVDVKWLDLAVNSVLLQFYDNWELCIVDDASDNQDTLNYLRGIHNNKIKVVFGNINRGISGATNIALGNATGEYVCFLDHDDELTKDALFEVVKAINRTDIDLIYSDEDKITKKNKFYDVFYKPDWSPDRILSHNYVCHLCVYKKQLLDSIGYLRENYVGSQDHDLVLRFTEKTHKIHHIPKVLYHWRAIQGSTALKGSEKSYPWENGRKALQDAMKRRKIDADVVLGDSVGTYRVKYKIKNYPLVSIITPFKDKPKFLELCINSILDKTTYRNFEFWGISNNSEDPETFKLMKYFEHCDARVKFVEYNYPFNYSKINNHAVFNYINGDHVILLNNDIEIITSDWIEALLEHSQRESVGVVGAKLYYRNDTLQHAGVVIGMGGVAGHFMKGWKRYDSGYFYNLQIVSNCCALTAACCMVKKSIYYEIGGMDENNLTVAFNDVDFSLRVMKKGYINVFTSYCEAYHDESISRGYDNTPEKRERHNKEAEYCMKYHSKILIEGDPYYNRNLWEDFK